MEVSAGTKHRITRTSFIERTLNDINDALENSFFAETTARQNGLLQRLDPRTKIISLVLLLLAVNFSHQIIIITGFYIFAVLLALSSKVHLGYFLKRTWLVVLVFTGIMAIPALFLTPGASWLNLPGGLVITETGARSAVFLLLRVGTSVSFAVLMILSTRWNDILKALGSLRIPDVVVLTLMMTYRYIHLLLHLSADMFLSRKSRILRKLSSGEGRRLMGSTSGILISKSLQLSSEVYLAMESRGFRGTPRTMNQFRFGSADAIAFFVVILISVSAIYFGR